MTSGSISSSKLGETPCGTYPETNRIQAELATDLAERYTGLTCANMFSFHKGFYTTKPNQPPDRFTFGPWSVVGDGRPDRLFHLSWVNHGPFGLSGARTPAVFRTGVLAPAKARLLSATRKPRTWPIRVSWENHIRMPRHDPSETATDCRETARPQNQPWPDRQSVLAVPWSVWVCFAWVG